MAHYPEHQNPPGRGVAQTAASIAAGTLRAADVAREALERVSNLAHLRAMIRVDADAVMLAANEADRLTFEAVSKRPLHGVPLVVKDNIDLAGYPTTAGSPAMAGFLPRQNATVVSRLLNAGAIVLGKANMHELSRGVTNANPTFGAALNPVNPAFIAGGSSGGTAVAVASGMVCAGIGTDTGGSARIPSALCGIVGMRPTSGRWPSDGVVPVSRMLDTPGPMGRKVADCALLDSVITGESRLATVALAGLRIGVPRAHYWDCIEPEVARVMAEARGRLEQAGVILVECELPAAAASAEAIKAITRHEAFPSLRAYFAHHCQEFDPHTFIDRVATPSVRAIFEEQVSPSSATLRAYSHAVNVIRPTLQQQYRDCFERLALEALLFPTTLLVASPLGEETHSLPGRPDWPTFAAYTHNTGPASLAAVPSISLPAGMTKQGLPVGLELDAPEGADRRLLAIAEAVEILLA